MSTNNSLKLRQTILWALAALLLLPFALRTYSVVTSTSSIEALCSKDVFQDYLAGRAIRLGVDPYLPLSELVKVIPNECPLQYVNVEHSTPHTPLQILIAAGLASLNYSNFMSAWLALSVCAVLLLAYRCISISKLQSGIKLMVIASLLTLASTSTTVDLLTGNWSCIIAACIAEAVYRVKRGNYRLAGIALGLSVTLKIWTWPIFIWLIFKKKIYTLTSAISALIFLGAISAGTLFLVGSSPSEYLQRGLISSASTYASQPINQSVWSIPDRLFVGLSMRTANQANRSNSNISCNIPPIINSSSHYHLILFKRACLILVGVMVCLLMLFSLQLKNDYLSLSAITSLMCIISGISWNHYMISQFVSFALCFAVIRKCAESKPQKSIMITFALVGLNLFSAGFLFSGLEACSQQDFFQASVLTIMPSACAAIWTLWCIFLGRKVFLDYEKLGG